MGILRVSLVADDELTGAGGAGGGGFAGKVEMDRIDLTAVVALEVENAGFGGFFDFELTMNEHGVTTPERDELVIKIEDRTGVGGRKCIGTLIDWLAGVVAGDLLDDFDGGGSGFAASKELMKNGARLYAGVIFDIVAEFGVFEAEFLALVDARIVAGEEELEHGESFGVGTKARGGTGGVMGLEGDG